MAVRVVFMGSPEFALPSLRALAANYDIVGVVTQPDRPAGRGKQLTPPPVKLLAQELGSPIIQPRRLHGPQAIQQLRSWAPDVIVVAAFGKILRSEVLDLPQHGSINVHASLLPRWRGAAPIVAAILNGDKETGITIMRMDPGLDTGPILSQRALPIDAVDTAGSLSAKLAPLGAQLLLETLPGYLSGQLQPRPQPEAGVTSAPMLSKAEGELDLTQSAAALERKVRAFNPWPSAFILWKGSPLRIHRAHVEAGWGKPGERKIYNKLPVIATSIDLLALDEVQPAGKKKMSGKDFLSGARDWA